MAHETDDEDAQMRTRRAFFIKAGRVVTAVGATVGAAIMGSGAGDAMQASKTQSDLPPLPQPTKDNINRLLEKTHKNGSARMHTGASIAAGSALALGGVEVAKRMTEPEREYTSLGIKWTVESRTAVRLGNVKKVAPPPEDKSLLESAIPRRTMLKAGLIATAAGFEGGLSWCAKGMQRRHSLEVIKPTIVASLPPYEIEPMRQKLSVDSVVASTEIGLGKKIAALSAAGFVALRAAQKKLMSGKNGNDPEEGRGR